MKKISLVLPMFVIALLVTSTTLTYGQTATVCTLHTTDAGSNDKVVFNLNEIIYMRWTADGTVNIDASKGGVNDAAGGSPWNGQAATGVIQYTPTLGPGIYVITVNGQMLIAVSVATVLVIPELPLGIMMATIGCFAALGTFKLKRNKA